MRETRGQELTLAALYAFIEGFYNRQRLHSAIGYKAPTDMEQLAAAA